MTWTDRLSPSERNELRDAGRLPVERLDDAMSRAGYERLRTFEPTEDYHRFRVKVMIDRYEPDFGYVYHDVTAIGGKSAEDIALDIVRDKGDLSACVVACAELCPDCDHPLQGIGASPGHDADGCRHYSSSVTRRFACECRKAVA